MPRGRSLAVLCLAVCGLAAMPAPAQIIETIDHAEQYRACMKLARTTPEDAFESALAWEARGGGAPAKHCSAVALLANGQYRDAALRFEELAGALAGDQLRFRAEALAQAGQAWLLQDDLERAHAAQTAALEAQPQDADLWIDRALTRALAQNYWEAVDDLNEAENLAPERPDIFIFRASAYRYLDSLDLALEDADRGLGLNPLHPEGLLERGIIKRLQGDAEGARADWLELVNKASGTAAAESARANLEALDVKAE